LLLKTKNKTLNGHVIKVAKKIDKQSLYDAPLFWMII